MKAKKILDFQNVNGKSTKNGNLSEFCILPKTIYKGKMEEIL